MIGELINYIISLLLVDSAVMLYVGYYDLKHIEFNILTIPPLLVVPLFLYYVFWSIPMFPLLAIILNAIFIIVIAMGLMGWMDIVVSVRVPLLLPLFYIANPLLPVLGLVLGVVLAYLFFFYKYIRPILCTGASIFKTVTKVKREAIMLNYVMPPNVPMEIDPEKLSKIKEKILKSKTDCVDAVVGVPYIFIYSVGYALSILSVALAGLF